MSARPPDSVDPASFPVAVSGATGFVGRRLVEHLEQRGFPVRRLVRDAAHICPADIPWNPATGAIDTTALNGVGAVIHLAGENIATARWSEARKAAIRTSRVEGTRLLRESLCRLPQPPRVFVSASAVGYYGDRSNELLTEESPPGRGFLPDVVRDWEAAALPARQAGIRTVHLRIGMVLAPDGGALARLLTPFRLGLGGRVGNGRQYVSWIAREDLVRAIEHVLSAGELHGPVNLVAPTPVTNAEFARVLARVLGRPALLPIPAALVQAVFGEMGRELLLASARVLPTRLLATGFRFAYPQLEQALRAELARLVASPAGEG